MTRLVAASLVLASSSLFAAELKTPSGPTPVAQVDITYPDNTGGRATFTFASGRIWTASHVIEGGERFVWHRGPISGEATPIDFHRIKGSDLVWAIPYNVVPDSVPLAKAMPEVGELLWVVGFTSEGQLVKTPQYALMLEEETGELFCDGWSWPGLSGGALLNSRGELVGIDLGTVTFSRDIATSIMLRPLSRFALVVGVK